MRDLCHVALQATVENKRLYEIEKWNTDICDVSSSSDVGLWFKALNVLCWGLKWENACRFSICVQSDVLKAQLSQASKGSIELAFSVSLFIPLHINRKKEHLVFFSENCTFWTICFPQWQLKVLLHTSYCHGSSYCFLYFVDVIFHVPSCYLFLAFQVS